MRSECGGAEFAWLSHLLCEQYDLAYVSIFVSRKSFLIAAKDDSIYVFVYNSGNPTSLWPRTSLAPSLPCQDDIQHARPPCDQACRPSKSIIHHLQRRCKIFLAGVNLLLLTYCVLLSILFFCFFLAFFLFKSSRKWRADVILQFYWCIYRLFLGYFNDNMILVYTLEIIAIWCN